MIYLFYILILIMCFIGSIRLYIQIIDFAAKKLHLQDREKLSFFVPILIYSPVFFLVANINLQLNDALFEIPNIVILTVILCSIAIGFCSFLKRRFYLPLMVAFSCCLCSSLVPTESFDLPFPPIMQNGIIAIVWFVFAYGQLIFKKTDALFSAHSLALCICLFVFYTFSGISSTQLLLSAAFIGISLGYGVLNFPPAQLSINSAALSSLGFLLGFVLIGCGAEGMVLPIIIILSYFIVYMIIGIYNTFFNNNKNFYTQPLVQIKLCFRIMFILLFLAVMQMFVESSHSIFIFALLYAFWAISRMGDQSNQGFMAINKEVLSNVKKGFRELRDLWDKKQ